VDQELSQSRLIAELLGTLSVVALILAAIGLYSLINLMVTTRTREIGLRMAIGAKRSQILGAILRDAARLLVIGIGIGLAAALGVTQVIRSLLFGVAPADALTLTAVTALLLLIGLLAAFLPARRAASVSPLEALRLG
jgi:putative ABC transport system permease protein